MGGVHRAPGLESMILDLLLAFVAAFAAAALVIGFLIGIAYLVRIMRQYDKP